MKKLCLLLLFCSLAYSVYGMDNKMDISSEIEVMKEAIVEWGADKGEEELRRNIITVGVSIFRCSGFFIASQYFVSSSRCAKMFNTRKDADFFVNDYKGNSFRLKQVWGISETNGLGLGILETEEAYSGELPTLDMSLYKGINRYVVGYESGNLNVYQGRNSLIFDEVVDFEPSYFPSITKYALDGAPVVNGDGKIVGVFGKQQFKGKGWDYTHNYALTFTPVEVLFQLASKIRIPLKVDWGLNRNTSI